MTFRPEYECNGPTCLERVRAQTDEELLAEQWLVLNRHEQPLDENEEEKLDFCSRECLEAWLADEDSW